MKKAFEAFKTWHTRNKRRANKTAAFAAAGVFLAWLGGYNFNDRSVSVALFAALVMFVCAIVWENN